MGNLSKELSSWRKQIVTCKSGIITTIDFMDTRPNIMFIMNPTEATLLASIDHSPTPKNYDFKIKEHYTRLIGKPTRTRQCYIYNDSSIDCDVQVYSLYDEKFDPSWIKDFNIENVNISNETLEAIKEMITGKITIEGVKDGVILPVKDAQSFGKLTNLVQYFNVLMANSTDSTHIGLKKLDTDILKLNNELTSSNSRLSVILNVVQNIYNRIQNNTRYSALNNTSDFSVTINADFHRISILFIMGNGTLQIIKGSEIVNIPINGFMRDIDYSSSSEFTVKYIKPTDEIENAYILYKLW